jgi:hypothetical protein
MAIFVPSVDHVEAIINIAKRVQSGGISSDNFQTVFDAIMRIQYPPQNGVEVQINHSLSQHAAMLLSRDPKLQDVIKLILPQIGVTE